MEGRFVCYYRVSTDKQGRSGLGIEAQKETVARYLNGGGWEVVSEYTEIESGGKDDRPELAKAIRDCKLKDARLLVAKLDRLSRDLHFITGLRNDGVPFTVAEMPTMDETTCNMFGVMAQHERKVIGQRTRDALQVAKRNGTIKGQGFFGNPKIKKGERLPDQFRAAGAGDTTAAREKKKAEADKFAKDMAQVVREMVGDESWSLRKIADELNAKKFKTARKMEWTATAVKRVLDRATKKKPGQ